MSSGVGVAVLPLSSVPADRPHLVRGFETPWRAPVLAVTRYHAGPAEFAPLEQLRRQSWRGLESRVAA